VDTLNKKMNILFILVGLIILLVAERVIYSRSWPKGINASIRFDQDRAVEGDTVNLCETLEYTGRLPLPWVRMKFQMSKHIIMPDSPNSIVTDYYNREEVFSIGRMEKITRRLPVVCSKRGQHRIVGVDVVSSDILVTKRMVENFGGNAGITVYPRRTAVPPVMDAARHMIGENVVRRSGMADPFMFRGIRDYVPGDQLSHINWRATARTDQLAVNQFEHTSELCVSIWLCLEPHPEWVDEALSEESIRIAATLIGEFIDSGVPVSLCCNARDFFTGGVTLVGHGCSKEHKDNCLTALARLDLTKASMNIGKFIDSIPRTASDNEMVIVISTDTDQKLCEHVREATADRELFWLVSARIEETRKYPGLELIKNNCVWRVECER